VVILCFALGLRKGLLGSAADAWMQRRATRRDMVAASAAKE
jgi:hypothetical protein